MEQNEKARYKKWFPFTTYDLDELNNRDIVFCFHHAGGSASVYRKWTLKKEKINFVCVELPGKGTRRKERFIENFEELVVIEVWLCGNMENLYHMYQQK